MSIELKYNDLEYVESKKVYEQLPEFTRIAKYAQYNHKKKRRKKCSIYPNYQINEERPEIYPRKSN